MKMAHHLTDDTSSPKRPRRTYEDWELNRLEAEFALNSYPSRERRNGLAREMEVSPKQIQIWFQNRRARARILRRKADGIVENPIERMKLQWTSSTLVGTAKNPAGSKEASTWTAPNDENRPPDNHSSSSSARPRVPSSGSRCAAATAAAVATADFRVADRISWNLSDVSNSSFVDVLANAAGAANNDDDDPFTETFLTLFSPNFQSHTTYDF